jgi:hypothetical protein
MKTLFAGAVVAVGLGMGVPAQSEAQDCKWCETDGKIVEGEFTIVHLFHENAGTPYRECGTPATPDEESAASGPVPREGDCEACHEEWIEGTCSQHGFCNPVGCHWRTSWRR